VRVTSFPDAVAVRPPAAIILKESPSVPLLESVVCIYTVASLLDALAENAISVIVVSVSGLIWIHFDPSQTTRILPATSSTPEVVT